MDNETVQRWLDQLMTVLPRARAGLVRACRKHSLGDVLAEAGDSRLRPALEKALGLARHGNTALVYGSTYTQPLLRDGAVFAWVAVELDVADKHRRTVRNLLSWSAGWFELLPVPRAGQPAEHDRVYEIIDRLSTRQPAAIPLGLANDIAAHWPLGQVAVLRRRRKNYRVQCLSHGMDFDGRSNAIRALEQLADDCPNAGGVFCSLPTEDTDGETPATAHLMAPLLERGETVGYVCCNDGADLPANDYLALARLGRLAGPLTGRGAGGLVQRLKSLGPAGGETSLRRRLVVITLALSLVAGIGAWPVTHRVTAQASIEGLVQRAVVAPVDTYIAETLVRPGDVVEQGQTLARLDDRELRLQLRQSQGEAEKLENEYRRALADLDHSEARIVQARLEQRRAQTELLARQLQRLTLIAPISGVILAGDLSRALGTPVERGQTLFEVAPLDAYRLALLVDERDIAHVAQGQTGQLNLAALPGHEWRFAIERVSPVFEVVENSVHYRCEAELSGDTASLRPGMEGVAKIEAGRRSLAWVMLHRLFNWLRMQVWLWVP